MVIKTLHCTSLIYLQRNEQIQRLLEKKIHRGFHWTPQIFRRYVVLIGLVSHNLVPSSESTVEPLLRAWVLTVKTEWLWFICLSLTCSLTLLLDFRNKHLKAFLLPGTSRIHWRVQRKFTSFTSDLLATGPCCDSEDQTEKNPRSLNKQWKKAAAPTCML